MILKSNEVNKVYVGMKKEDVIKLETETCVKCKHLVDDHLKPLEDKGDYVCRNCGCKIK